MPTILACLVLAALAAPPATGRTLDEGDRMNDEMILVRFDTADELEWRVINDGVMGGVSQSRLERTDRGTAVFAGDLSLENNGGFASVRVRLAACDLSDHAGLEVRVRGDGRTYQLRLRHDDSFDGVAYRADMETTAGEWRTLRFPFRAVTPTFRGRTVPGAPALDPASIRQIGFLLADGRPGASPLAI